MSPETDPSRAEYQGRLEAQLQEQFADPKLGDLLLDYLMTVVDNEREILGISSKTLTENDKVYDQSTVDNAVESVLGIEITDEILEVADLFGRLDDQPTMMGSHQTSQFGKGVAFLASSEYAQRRDRQTKRIVDMQFQSARTILEFMEQLSTEISVKQFQDFLRQAGRPANQIWRQNRDETIATPHDDRDLAFSERQYSTLTSLDSEVDLSVPKLIIAATMYRVIKEFKIDELYETGVLQDKSKLIKNRDWAPAYVLKCNLDLLHEGKLEEYKIGIQLIREAHTSGRLFKLQNRSFKAALELLDTCSGAYRSLLVLQENLSEHQNKLRTVRDLHAAHLNLQQAQAISNIMGARDVVMQQLIVYRDRLIDGDLAGLAEPLTWDQAQKYERVVTERIKSFLNTMAENHVELTRSVRKQLIDYSNPVIPTMFAETQLERQLAILEPEIDSRTAALAELDGKYSLTNNQLRERDPRIVGLARSLIDHLNGDNSLSIDRARALVGLMLGVYHEQTGQGTSPEEWATTYLQDAFTALQLTQELAYLGKPQKSQFLDMIHLLDELLDSGMFDRSVEEFKALEEFLLSYLEARDGAPADTLSNDNDPEDGPDLPPVPVATVGEAYFEDLTVFPPGATVDDIIRDYRPRVRRNDLPRIEWERISELVRLRDHCRRQNLDVQLIRTRHASWQVLPFFVLEVSLPGSENAVAVVESPVYGNATYVYREAEDRLPWREAVQLQRQEARAWGAVPAIHVDSNQLARHTEKLWNRLLSELTVNV